MLKQLFTLGIAAGFVFCISTNRCSDTGLGCLASTEHPSGQDTHVERIEESMPHDESTTSLVWADYGEIAALIDELPRWSHESPGSSDDWRGYVRLALALRDMQPEDVERVLIVYMNRHPLTPESSSAAIWAHTKPFLLLRVMFDLPGTPLTDQDRGTWMREHHIAVLPGPIAYQSIEHQPWQPPFSLSLPIAWSAAGPSLMAYPLDRFMPGTGNNRDVFQPHLEYRYFAANYRFRDTLEGYLTEPAPTWQRLVLERHLPSEILDEIDQQRR